jgi:Na+/melibiose symporter-like transporter
MPSREMEEDTTMAAPREIKGRRLLKFCLLPMGNNFINAFLLSYVYFYYVYVVGLDSLLTSAGILIATIVSAIACVVFGVVSDNQPLGRHGKRKPLLLYGLPIFVATGILIWTPPVMCQPGGAMNWSTAIYLWVIMSVYMVGLNVNWASYNAMVPEQLETEQNRQEASKLQGLLNLIAITFGVATPIILQSVLANPEQTLWIYPSGQFLVMVTPTIAGVLTVIAVAMTLVTYRSVDETFLDKNVKKKSIGAMFKDMQYPLRDKNARSYFGIMIAVNMGGKIFTTIPIPFLTYVLLVQGFMFTAYMLLAMVVNFSCIFVWAIIVKRRGTIKANNLGFLVMIASLLALTVLFIDMPNVAKIIVTMVLFATALLGAVAFYVTPLPIISAIIDEAPGKFPGKEFKKETLSGLYTGMSSLFVNVAGALGTLFMGFYFSGGNEANPFLLTLIMPITAVVYVIGWISNKKLSIASQCCPAA